MAGMVDASQASKDSKPSITDLISSYGILPTLASYVSTIDLYHLALTNRSHFSYIAASPNIFKVLQRQCLCDGRGLLRRQAYRNFNFVRNAGAPSLNQHFYGDEEIEVRLYNIKCDEAGALPCVKCGINICEECRVYSRARPSYPSRRPHINANLACNNIMYLCEMCDAATEEEVAGKFLNELCDCDVYTRWICRQCKTEEGRFCHEYFDNHTKIEHVWSEEEHELYYNNAFTLVENDAGWDRAFWCTCGSKVDWCARARCTLCKRRHLPDSEWDFKEAKKVPFFDNDPDYPCWVQDEKGKYPTPYPPLGRDRR